MITSLHIPPLGHVTYLDHLGDDNTIVRAARISTGQELKSPEKDDELLDYLFRNRHTSPFEQPIIRFNIKMPIFVMRQFVRHRTFRLNEWSGRYSKMRDETYAPRIWRRQLTEGNKQGSEAFGEPGDVWNDTNNAFMRDAYSAAFNAYTALLKRGVAKELARIVLPQALYTEIVVSCDLHNLMHFFNLRCDPHAQKEIQDVAMAMLRITEQLFPRTIKLWDKYKLRMVEENRLRISRVEGKDYNGCSPETD